MYAVLKTVRERGDGNATPATQTSTRATQNAPPAAQTGLRWHTYCTVNISQHTVNIQSTYSQHTANISNFRTQF